MAKISSLVAGVSLAVLTTASAFAADLPSRRAPAPYIAPPPVFTWTGFYVGLNAGASFSVNNNNQNNNFGLFAATGNPIFLTNNNNNQNNVGFVGGGQIGYNWQTGPVVFGLEADAQYRSNIGGNNGNNFFGGGNNNNNGGFYGTARGRLGYSITPMFMIYATGGAAFGNVANNNGFNPFFFGNNNNGGNFRVGYAVGGGLEYAFAPNWSMKAEALYNDLGRGNNGGGFGFGGGNNQRNQFVVARLGVNYRFNWGATAPVVARY